VLLCNAPLLLLRGGIRAAPFYRAISITNERVYATPRLPLTLRAHRKKARLAECGAIVAPVKVRVRASIAIRADRPSGEDARNEKAPSERAGASPTRD